MQALLDVVLPVFLLIGFGYLAVLSRYFSHDHVDGLMQFTQTFAIPALLFRAISTLDLSASFDWRLLASFYLGAVLCFLAGLYGARYLFRRDWEDSVAIGFCCLFSNSLMLGLPITERAFGPGALEGNYAIVALHSPFCYGLGITVMEFVRARGQSVAATSGTVLKAMFSNALILGIGLGFVVNLSGVALPGAFTAAVDLLVRAALPAALFGMGGVLVRYRPEGDIKVILAVCAVTLLLHPALTTGFTRVFEVPDAGVRSAVLTAAMAPGINTYVFAHMYGRARRVAASVVLLATAISVLTVWLWLFTLP